MATEAGAHAPLGAVCLHDEVRLVCTDGRVIEGRSIGSEWWGPEPFEPLLQVEANGEALIVREDEIATITPLGRANDREALMQWLGDLMSRAHELPEGEGRYFDLILDDHTTLDVEIRRRTHPCSPPKQPPWL